VKKNICYGYIPAEHAGHTDGFEIESYKKIYPAKFESNRALYDPQRKKIMA
jgi:glycine cleavage system aminomethyltransferase T